MTETKEVYAAYLKGHETKGVQFFIDPRRLERLQQTSAAAKQFSYAKVITRGSERIKK